MGGTMVALPSVFNDKRFTQTYNQQAFFLKQG
jgi:hypothetical protein